MFGFRAVVWSIVMAAISCIAVTGTPQAADIYPNDLSAWTQEVGRADDSPCNYMYLYNDTARNARVLLYYGMSKHCGQRLREHLNEMNKTGLIVKKAAQYFNVVPNTTGEKNFFGAMAGWGAQVNQNGGTLNNGSSDSCLGMFNLLGNGSVWYQIASGHSAQINYNYAIDFESCILHQVMGVCNRSGGGSTNASFAQAYQSCGTSVHLRN